MKKLIIKIFLALFAILFAGIILYWLYLIHWSVAAIILAIIGIGFMVSLLND